MNQAKLRKQDIDYMQKAARLMQERLGKAA